MLKSPVYRAMETGTVARLEEISRCASEVQDALISILSEKRISVPELGVEVPAQKGFSLIATANTRDKGVNEMSAALKRRFNIVVLPAPASLEAEMDIVRTRVEQLAGSLDLNAALPAGEVVEKVCTIFREMRSGQTLDGAQKLKPPTGVLSTAEAISSWPTPWPWRAASVTGASPTATWPPVSRGPWSRTRTRTAWPGRNTLNIL